VVVMNLVGSFTGIAFTLALFYLFKFVYDSLNRLFGDYGKLYYDDSSSFSIDNIPHNIKTKSRTKERWAKRSQQYDDSFANGIMWADLGND
jgi:hypothetical protein